MNAQLVATFQGQVSAFFVKRLPVNHKLHLQLARMLGCASDMMQGYDSI
jgi:hypothetical protein